MVDMRDLHSAVCSSYANTLHLLDSLRSFRPDVVYVWNLIGIGVRPCWTCSTRSGCPGCCT